MNLFLYNYTAPSAFQNYQLPPNRHCTNDVNFIGVPVIAVISLLKNKIDKNVYLFGQKVGNFIMLTADIFFVY